MANALSKENSPAGSQAHMLSIAPDWVHATDQRQLSINTNSNMAKFGGAIGASVDHFNTVCVY
ncbi:hypothetical protein [Corynebacterium freiburgense]|uniref:hypothetical protein n=1 Tax=Corynebacterium freiburgense TaxID=556548 RepID=UPI0012EBEFB4|nr:hypothetical protein [Corynebacterium freiburgense]